MLHRLTFALCTLNFLNTSAQNLVPNSSFENITACPSNYSEIGNAGGWDFCGGEHQIFTTPVRQTPLRMFLKIKRGTNIRRREKAMLAWPLIMCTNT